MFSSENREGRLVELRIVTPISSAEMVELQETHLAVTESVESDYVAAVDLRRAHVFPPEISEHFIRMMSQLNPRLVRSALLVNQSAILGLQAERAIEAAGNPDRKTFREPHEMESWLGEVLNASELTRLRRFVLEGTLLGAS